MPILRTSIYLFCIALPCLSCQKSRSGVVKPVHGDLPTRVESPSLPMSYSLGDQTCSNSGQIVQEAAIWSPIQDNSTLKDIRNQEIAASPLHSKSIRQVLMSTTYEQICDALKSPPPTCSDSKGENLGWNETSAGLPIKACPTRRDATRRDSLDNIALSVVSRLQTIADSFNSLLGPRLPRNLVDIQIAPRFASIWVPWTVDGLPARYETILTDNTSYFPPSGTIGATIAILPQSKEKSNDIRLWDLDFVLAHEYAHHVEFSLGYDQFAKNRSLIRVAVSEGFADAMAYASLGAKVEALSGLPCLEADRNPSRNEFHSGIAKVFGTTVIKGLSLDFADASTQSGCQNLMPTSPHGMGAILAHVIWKTASLCPGFSSHPTQTIVDIGQAWLNAVNSSIGPGLGPTVQSSDPDFVKDLHKDLIPAAIALEKTIRNQFSIAGQSPTADQLTLLRQVMNLSFPTIQNQRWFENAN